MSAVGMYFTCGNALGGHGQGAGPRPPSVSSFTNILTWPRTKDLVQQWWFHLACYMSEGTGGSSRPSRGERARLHTSQRPLAVGPIQIPNGVGRHGDRQ